MNTTVLFTIVRNKTNTVIFASDSYKNLVTFIKNHFPKTSYIYDEELDCIELNSKNFTFSMVLLNTDIF